MSELKELIQYVSKALVDMPEEVTVNEIVGEQTTVVELKVDKSDLGKVVSLCQTIWFLNCIFSRATQTSLSQFEPGKIITDDFI